MSFQAFAENVKTELLKFPADAQKDVVILFSAHSLPMKVFTILFPSSQVKQRKVWRDGEGGWCLLYSIGQILTTPLLLHTVTYMHEVPIKS